MAGIALHRNKLSYYRLGLSLSSRTVLRLFLRSCFLLPLLPANSAAFLDIDVQLLVQRFSIMTAFGPQMRNSCQQVAYYVHQTLPFPL